ncbi:hypothetical protein [Sinorhizobium arboris]|uniref:hypothetical protein n=1 Tax=Sinorhizobium arboris TaxID=76745 RepID=UPI00048294CD|nr:hypothetical protein [Sinorhizobium arboris]
MKLATLRLTTILLVVATSFLPAIAANGQHGKEGRGQGQNMKNFVEANPDCLEFDDQCSVCSLTDGVAECSTPKTACVKGEYRCTMRSK